MLCFQIKSTYLIALLYSSLFAGVSGRFDGNQNSANSPKTLQNGLRRVKIKTGQCKKIKLDCVKIKTGLCKTIKLDCVKIKTDYVKIKTGLCKKIKLDCVKIKTGLCKN